MLVLARRRNESVMIGDEISVMITDIQGNQVKMGISAPLDMNIARAEIRDKPPSQARINRAKLAAKFKELTDAQVVQLLEAM